MADSSVQLLHDALAGAAAGPVILNEAFWTAAKLVPPPGFDAAIRTAYRLPAEAPGLSITYDRAAVGPIGNAGFSIPGVTLAFLEAPAANITATLNVAPGSSATPVLGLDVVPVGWQLASQFPAMDTRNWPFALLTLDQQRFYFASAATSIVWNGQTLSFQPGQNLYGMATVGEQVSTLLPLLSGLSPVGTVSMAGPIDLSKVDNATILLPETDLQAPLASTGLKLFFISVDNPRLGFRIKTVEAPAGLSGEDGDVDSAPTAYFQNPIYYLAADVTLHGADSNSVGLTLQVGVSRLGSRFSFSASALDSDKPVTPAAILSLMGTSYFQLVPPILQQYLAAVQMEGFSVSGPLVASPAIGTLSARIGSVQGQPIPLFSDPTTSQVFEITSFSLDFAVANPTVAARRQVTGSVTAVFTLFPSVFKTLDGQPGGLFQVTIDQDLNILGGFSGSVALSDVLSFVTGGAIGLPQGIAVSFSDVTLSIRPSQKSYALGFVVDAEVSVPFIEYHNPQTGASRPLIEVVGLRFDLSASTPNPPKGQKGVSVYAGSMAGQILIGPLAAAVSLVYDGTPGAPLWTLDASLTQPLVLSDLTSQFFRSDYVPPDFLPGSLTVQSLAVHATIPVESNSIRISGRQRPRVRSTAGSIGFRSVGAGWRSPVRDLEAAGASKAYTISCKIEWVFKIADIPVDIVADLALDYDEARPQGQRFGGSVIGTVSIANIGPVQIGYSFEPPAAALSGALLRGRSDGSALAARAGSTSDATLWVSWKGFRAAYDVTNESVTFTLTGWTAGSLLTAFVEMIGDPYFTLPSPWDLLDSIPLDGFALTFFLKSDAPYRVSATYTLPSPLDLVFVTISSVTFRQTKAGTVTLAFTGSSPVDAIQNGPLFKAGSDGQDVSQMPTVPGRGNKYFDLQLLALGQRVSLFGAPAFTSTQQVITALEKVPSSSRDTIPFDPAQRQPGQPFYNAAADWLCALHLGLFKLPGAPPAGTPGYAIDVQIVFADPDLYGLRLALNGDKVKVLSGLVIDVLYKKITDDIGCYQIEFTLPTVLRNLQFGAVSITLPSIGVQIYTNGDFLIDFGFPYNMDFSQSFSIYAVILGIPVVGSAGFYFGKLSNATAPNLPVTNKGTFHPVIVFGLGAQIGLGYSIDKGILKAGFSITVFGIIEGTIAAWHPYDGTSTGDPQEVQGDYFFLLTGTFGILGKLYGTVDFAIIKADVSLTVTVYVQIAYESYRKIPLTLSASVEVSVSISIDLGLFSISISFSFSTTLVEHLTIGSDSVAPWDPESAIEADVLRFGRDGALLPRRGPPLARTLFEHGIIGRPVRLDLMQPHRVRGAAPAAKQTLNLSVVTQFTVLAPEGAAAAAVEGGLVLLFAMPAPTADAPGAGDADTAFGQLCAALLPWLIASVTPDPSAPPLPPLAPGTVSRPLLEAILMALADPAQPPFDADQLTAFLSANFHVAVTHPDAAPAGGTTIFPAPAFLTLTVPDPGSATGTVALAFNEYTSSTPTYQRNLRKLFNSVAANVGAESPAAPHATLDDSAEPMAATVFTDYFILLARQLVQTAIDGFDDYSFPLASDTSLQSILSAMNTLAPGQLTPSALAAANLNYPLNANLVIEMADVSYTVQAGDTIASIVARYADPSPGSTTAEALILANRARNNLIAPKIVVETGTGTGARCYTTASGDDFESIAKGLGITTEALAAEKSVYTLGGLLAPGIDATIPAVRVTTRAGDTIGGILERLAVPAASFLTAANLSLGGLFAADPKLRFAVPQLVVLASGDLWPAILASGRLGHIGGMCARFMLHGMRLPAAAGLKLPGDFLYGAPRWPATQSGYGVYQLTGQQFPLASRSGGYPVALARPDDKDHSWFALNGGAAMSFDICAQTTLLAKVVASARKYGYAPAVTALEAESAIRLSPRRYGAATCTSWQTSDVAEIAAVTCSPGTAAPATSAAAGGPQPKAFLFGLSRNLLAAVERTQAGLQPTLGVSQLLPYLPVLSPCVGTSDPATATTDYASIDAYSFAMRVDFSVKQLAQDADLAPQQPTANDVTPTGVSNSGSKARPLAPFAYEVIGPTAAQAVLLERMLTAMATEGEGLISGLFLLYEDPGSNALVSRGSSEFVSFLVQSNLSTETNPPASARLADEAATTQPTGILNSPAEFIKLLWELSTVNSGGTYLFYQLVAEGAGLPSALFGNDGVATVSLVATLARNPSLPLGQRVFNAVNALVTTSPIDPASSVVDLLGVSAPAPSQPLPAGATAGDLARLYGIDVGTLAAANGGVSLTLGSAIPLSGLFHQLLPADVGPGQDPLTAVASYYSSGVSPAITKQQILDFNHGVDVAALAVFRIPPFVYTVAAAGPGATLDSITAYYGITAAAVASAAQDVASLFDAPNLTIDPVAYDAVPRLGRGNAGLSLVRERGSVPASSTQTIEDYTRATLLQLYQLLSAGIERSPFFSQSADSAAFGPKDPPSSATPPAVRPRAVRVTAPADDQPYCYDQTLGFAASALVNAAPAVPAQGLPPASANPYVGIGSVVQLRLAWQDLFGNRMASAFSAPLAGDPGPFGNVPVPLLYADRLIPLDAWPSTTRSYCYGGPAGAPVLRLKLVFDTSPYEPAPPPAGSLHAVRFGDDVPVWQRTAITDLARFELIYFQLNQDYDAAGVSGLAGPAVTISLVNSLLETVEQPLPADAREGILDYVAAAILYLSARAAGTASPRPADMVAELPVDIGMVAPAEDILQLEVALRFTRQSGLVAPELRASDGGLSVSATILAQADQPPPPPPPPPAPAGDTPPETPVPAVELLSFAHAFETAFATADWQMRLGTGAPDPAAASDIRRPTLWAVRMPVASGSAPQGVSFTIGGNPGYFAPLPVATSLQPITTDIPQYQTGASYPVGAPIPTSFTSVDPNVWFAECLAAIDDILSATYSTPLFFLDRLLGLKEVPTGPNDPHLGYLPRLLEHKKVLAAAIAGTATSVLEPKQEALRTAACDKLEQALLRRLSDANSVTCVAVFPVSGAYYAPPLPAGVSPPRLFGQPLGTLCSPAAGTDSSPAAGTDNFALSTAKIALTTDAGGASDLAFLVTSRSAEANAFIELDLSFSLSHVEHEIHAVPGIQNYEQSRWISFVTGPFVTPMAAAAAQPYAIPVPLRALPSPPTVVAQTGTATFADDKVRTPAQLKLWDYGFSFLLKEAAQDSVLARVQFNQGGDGNGAADAAADPQKALYAALARFVAIYPAVARDIETFLRPITGTSRASDPNIKDAVFAIAALDTVVAEVASTFRTWAAGANETRLAETVMPRIDYRFELELTGEEGTGQALVTIVPECFTVDGGDVPNFLPPAMVLIYPDNYQPVQVAGAVPLAWRYQRLNSNPPQYLAYEAARTDPSRSILFSGLDLLAVQSGCASIQVARNRHLSPDPAVTTNPVFCFTTAAAGFAEPLVPLLDRGEFALDSGPFPLVGGGGDPAPVADWLKGCFTPLLTTAPSIPFTEPVLLSIETRYSFSQSAQGVDMPLTVLPVSLLAPTSTGGSAEPPAVAAVAAFAQQWFDAQKPLADAPAGFGFSLTVFSGTAGNQLPLMKIRALTLQATSITIEKQ